MHDIKDLEKKYPVINVRINSPGGSVWDGLAIFNALTGSTARIHTWNDGLAASMAAVILLAGHKIHAAKNSLMMIHSPSTMVAGNRNELEKSIAVLDKVQESLIGCILQHTEKSREEIQGGASIRSDVLDTRCRLRRHAGRSLPGSEDAGLKFVTPAPATSRSSRPILPATAACAAAAELP